MVGSILRLLSTWRFIVCSEVFDQSGFMVALIGQILTACAQPFLLYSPTKLAAFWFGPKERAFCTMLASLGNPIGLALAQLVSPNVVTETSRLRILVSHILLVVCLYHSHRFKVYLPFLASLIPRPSKRSASAKGCFFLTIS